MQWGEKWWGEENGAAAARIESVRSSFHFTAAVGIRGMFGFGGAAAPTFVSIVRVP